MHTTDYITHMDLRITRARHNLKAGHQLMFMEFKEVKLTLLLC